MPNYVQLNAGLERGADFTSTALGFTVSRERNKILDRSVALGERQQAETERQQHHKELGGMFKLIEQEAQQQYPNDPDAVKKVFLNNPAVTMNAARLLYPEQQQQATLDGGVLDSPVMGEDGKLYFNVRQKDGSIVRGNVGLDPDRFYDKTRMAVAHTGAGQLKHQIASLSPGDPQRKPLEQQYQQLIEHGAKNGIDLTVPVSNDQILQSLFSEQEADDQAALNADVVDFGKTRSLGRIPGWDGGNYFKLNQMPGQSKPGTPQPEQPPQGVAATGDPNIVSEETPPDAESEAEDNGTESVEPDPRVLRKTLKDALATMQLNGPSAHRAAKVLERAIEGKTLTQQEQNWVDAVLTRRGITLPDLAPDDVGATATAAAPPNIPGISSAQADGTEGQSAWQRFDAASYRAAEASNRWALNNIIGFDDDQTDRFMAGLKGKGSDDPVWKWLASAEQNMREGFAPDNVGKELREAGQILKDGVWPGVKKAATATFNELPTTKAGRGIRDAGEYISKVMTAARDPAKPLPPVAVNPAEVQRMREANKALQAGDLPPSGSITPPGPGQRVVYNDNGDSTTVPRTAAKLEQAMTVPSAQAFVPNGERAAKFLYSMSIMRGGEPSPQDMLIAANIASTGDPLGYEAAKVAAQTMTARASLQSARNAARGDELAQVKKQEEVLNIYMTRQRELITANAEGAIGAVSKGKDASARATQVKQVAGSAESQVYLWSQQLSMMGLNPEALLNPASQAMLAEASVQNALARNRYIRDMSAREGLGSWRKLVSDPPTVPQLTDQFAKHIVLVANTTPDPAKRQQAAQAAFELARINALQEFPNDPVRAKARAGEILDDWFSAE